MHPAGIIASAQLSATGGGGGGVTFPAQAVQFPDSELTPAYLESSGLAAANSSRMGFSVWVDGLVTALSRVVFFVEENPVVTLGNIAFMQFDNQWIYFGGGSVDAGVQWRVENTFATAGVHHLLGAWDTNQAAGAKLAAFYIDDVFVPPRRKNDSDAAFTMPLNGLPCGIASLFGGSDYVGGMAELWVDREVLWIDENGRIPTATRRKFINADLMPVDLGADGSTPTGTQPMIFLSGDADAFVVNKGSEEFTLVNGPLTDADGIEPLVAPAGLPSNSVAPVVSGTAQVGQTLTCTTGTWSGAAPLVYSYDWISGPPNFDRLGETADSLTITEDMGVVGDTLSCIVRAANAVWTNLAFSNATDPVAP